MPNNAEAWLKRAKEVLAAYYEKRSPVVPFTVSLLTATYGPQSTQLNAFNPALAQHAKNKEGLSGVDFYQNSHAATVIENVIAEMDAGLVGSLRAQVAGEVLSELVGLGKEILGDNTPASKNVAAVLIAAAFEDLIRRMGSDLAGVAGRPKLESVLTSIKDAQVLQGGAVGTAIGYLKFRNDSLHADWDKVSEPQIQSCIGFIEGLLLKHFS